MHERGCLRRRQGDNTALHWASMRGHVEVVSLLLSKGADKTIRNKQSMLPARRRRTTVSYNLLLAGRIAGRSTLPSPRVLLVLRTVRRSTCASRCGPRRGATPKRSCRTRH